MAPCFAPSCQSGYNSTSTRAFRPTEAVAGEWVRILGKIRAYKDFDPSNINHRLCHLHFEPHLIKKEDTFLINGELTSMPRLHWELNEAAVPTIFPNLPKYRQLKLPAKRVPKRPAMNSTGPPPKARGNDGTPDPGVEDLSSLLHQWIHDFPNWSIKNENGTTYLYHLAFSGKVSVSHQIMVIEFKLS